MESIQRKIQEQRQLEQKQRERKRNDSIKQLVDNEQVRIMLEYIDKQLPSLTFSQISTHSAAEISKLIFDEQLKQIETEFKKLPDELCSLQQFVLVMFKVLKFELDVSPEASIGLREMFATIASGRRLIDYQSVFRYMVGQVVTAKEEVTDTVFQMRFQEHKLQDFLFHDKGIKRVFYSKELKVTICLDRETNQLKFYDKDMKLIGRFYAAKQKHEGRNPAILDMGFCQIYSRLGLVLDDSTVTIINMKPFLSGDSDFYLNSVNEISQKTGKQMKNIYYLEMCGKWLVIAEDNSVFRLDPQRNKPEERFQEFHIGIPQFTLADVLQLTPLNMVCLIGGNQVNFFNENLSQKHYVFYHGANIKMLRYSQPQNRFYLCGKESIITVFERDKLANDFKTKTIELGKIKINSFEIFPELGVIVILDDLCQVRLYDYNRKVMVQQQNFKHIKKNQQEVLMCKTSKHDFCLYETYMVGLEITKVAIETEADCRFSPCFYYNSDRELFYCAANNQIASVHLLRGEVEDDYNEDNSNINKHLYFFLDQKTHIFIIDDNNYLYELYRNDQKLEGQNRNYKRKIGLDKVKGASYSENGIVLAWSDNKVIQVKNDANNNFTIINSIQFENGERIRDVHFIDGLISVFCWSATSYDFNYFTMALINSRQFRLSNLQLEGSEEEAEILQYLRADITRMEILLCNNNIVMIVLEDKTHCLKLEEYLPKSKISYNFTKIRYQELKIRKKIQSTEVSDDVYDEPTKQKFTEQITKLLYAMDQNGFIVSMDIGNILKQSENKLRMSQIINDAGVNGFEKGGIILEQKVESVPYLINKSTVVECPKPKILKGWKAHEKEVVQAVGIIFEQPCTITYANDGFFKLWNDKSQCLFSLKMPSFSREYWNMEQIEKMKCQTNILKIQRLMRDYKRRIKEENDSHTVQELIFKTRNFKRNFQERPSFLEPFTIQIDNREIEDLMNRTQFQLNRRFSFQEKKTRNSSHSSNKPIQHSPWKKNPKLIQMIEAVQKKHKDEKTPAELVKLRASLDVKKPTFESPEKLMRVPFLPQLQHYTPEPKTVDEETIPAIDLNEQQPDMVQGTAYLRNKRLSRRINMFDEIDKEFQRKRIQQCKNVKKNAVIKVAKKEEQRVERENKKEMKGDLIEQISKIFEEHNKEVSRTKKGRMREMPKINIKKQDQF